MGFGGAGGLDRSFVAYALRLRVASKQRAEGAHGVGDAATGFDDLLIGALGFEVPLPAVFEGRDLGGGAAAVLLGEEDVVGY